MKSVYLKEQKRYSIRELRNVLGCAENDLVHLIRKLKEYGLIKVVRKTEYQEGLSELADEDIELADVDYDDNGYYYVLTYVGIAVVAGVVLKCFPKYISSTVNPHSELKQILKVLAKINSSEQVIKLYNDNSENVSINILAVMIAILNDYYTYGTYSNTEDVIESNGNGEILWDRTINETFTILSDNRPYYVDLQTKHRKNDDYDFFKRLHECVITEICRELNDAGLLDYFELDQIELTEELLEDFGDKDYILYRIEKELSVQFNTRKQSVLKMLHVYINHDSAINDQESVSFYGTNAFNIVWEKVCAEVFDDKLGKTLGTLEMKVPLRSEYDSRMKLIDVIEKPLWTYSGKTAQDTLIPDIVSIHDNGEGYDFIILDAKYYNAILERNTIPKGQPGIESITKQYLYQLAYQKFISDHEFSEVYNCFLLPVEGEEVINKEEVKLEMFRAVLPKLKDIKVRFIPAKIVFEYYLKDEKYKIEDLVL